MTSCGPSGRRRFSSRSPTGWSPRPRHRRRRSVPAPSLPLPPAGAATSPTSTRWAGTLHGSSRPSWPPRDLRRGWVRPGPRGPVRLSPRAAFIVAVSLSSLYGRGRFTWAPARRTRLPPPPPVCGEASPPSSARTWVGSTALAVALVGRARLADGSAPRPVAALSLYSGARRSGPAPHRVGGSSALWRAAPYLGRAGPRPGARRPALAVPFCSRGAPARALGGPPPSPAAGWPVRRALFAARWRARLAGRPPAWPSGVARPAAAAWPRPGGAWRRFGVSAPLFALAALRPVGPWLAARSVHGAFSHRALPAPSLARAWARRPAVSATRRAIARSSPARWGGGPRVRLGGDAPAGPHGPLVRRAVARAPGARRRGSPRSVSGASWAHGDRVAWWRARRRLLSASATHRAGVDPLAGHGSTPGPPAAGVGAAWAAVAGALSRRRSGLAPGSRRPGRRAARVRHVAARSLLELAPARRSSAARARAWPLARPHCALSWATRRVRRRRQPRALIASAPPRELILCARVALLARLGPSAVRRAFSARQQLAPPSPSALRPPLTLAGSALAGVIAFAARALLASAPAVRLSLPPPAP